MSVLFLALGCVSPAPPGDDASKIDDTGPDSGVDTSGESGDDTADDTGEDSDDASGDSDTGDETGASADLRPLNLSVVPAPAVQTVLVATWTTAQPCLGTAFFSFEDGEVVSTTEREATTTHRQLLLGIPSEMAVTGGVSCADGDLVGPRTDFDARTGPLPAGITDLTLTGTADAGGGFLTVARMVPLEAATIIDMKGRVVWYWLEAVGSSGTHVRLSVDGASVLINVQDESPAGASGRGGIRRVSLEGAELASIPVDLHSHDYEELPDGTIAAIAADIRPYGKENFRGDQIVEVAPDGTSRQVWSGWDLWTPDTAPPDHATGRGSWTHGNAIDYDPVDDSYWLSLRNLSVILHIDRATGAVSDQLGGPTPNWTFNPPEDAMDGEHQFELLGDGILVFDNQYTSAQTRAVEYGFDGTAHTLTKRWSYVPAEQYFEQALGDVDRTEDGSTRVTFSTEGTIHQVDPDGNVEWTLSVAFGETMGYTDHITSMYGG